MYMYTLYAQRWDGNDLAFSPLAQLLQQNRGALVCAEEVSDDTHIGTYTPLLGALHQTAAHTPKQKAQPSGNSSAPHMPTTSNARKRSHIYHNLSKHVL
jgi:hypothetical protein